MFWQTKAFQRGIWLLPCLLIGLTYFQPQIPTVLVNHMHFESPFVDRTVKTNITSSFFHFIIPAKSPTPAVCRTLFSAGVLNYPAARIVSWNQTNTKADLPDGGFHRRKVDNLLDALNKINKLDASRADDLVYITSGNDTWFQLRPEVLIKRYHEINARANRRIQARYSEPYDQKVIFSAQRECQLRGNGTACAIVPPSELPEDVYGNDADKINLRPRHLSSHSIMGPVKSLKALYDQAHIKLSKQKNLTEDEIFTEIFTKQEHHRELLRAAQNGSDPHPFLNLTAETQDNNNNNNGQETAAHNSSMVRRADHPRNYPRGTNTTEGCGSQNGTTTSSETGASNSTCKVQVFDYGIGLDYLGELFRFPDAEESEFQFIDFAQEDAAKSVAEAVGSTHIAQVGQDIRHSTPPYWTPDYMGEKEFPDLAWEQAKLYTNVRSGVIPAVIGHATLKTLSVDDDSNKANNSTSEDTSDDDDDDDNSSDSSDSRDQDTSLIDQWKQNWFHPHLRKLSDAYARSWRMPLAVISKDEHTRHEYWGFSEGIAGARIHHEDLPGKWLQWDQLCGDVRDVFNDDHDKFTNPVYYLYWNGDKQREQLHLFEDQDRKPSAEDD
ncbi:hypothetical protein PV10_08505 [Exophiala mesophila]|uniref:Uncharacterized protein n=1 Tax=Exophiala mesophila TaxID=212818 RepID=A0A0D1Z258_EXOME|nr:uncharacterized protein PV10_08505 [Exophiala mesophila]KIV88872.1 hypothetical protein PV10_08505 [Exophiala mesophila]